MAAKANGFVHLACCVCTSPRRIWRSWRTFFCGLGSDTHTPPLKLWKSPRRAGSAACALGNHGNQQGMTSCRQCGDIEAMKYHGWLLNAISDLYLHRFAISEKSSCRVAVLRYGNSATQGRGRWVLGGADAGLRRLSEPIPACSLLRGRRTFFSACGGNRPIITDPTQRFPTISKRRRGR